MSGDMAWEDWTAENLLRELPEKWRLSLIAMEHGTPAAYAVISRKPQSVHLHHLIVGPGHRGGGLGGRLLRRWLDAARAEGVSLATLKVHDSNARALDFYRAHGFEAGERQPNGYLNLFLSCQAPGGDQGGSMRVAVHQPNFIPWCGYFAKMRSADLFILQDDVQFSRGGYVNRAQVITTKGPNWLTIPVPKGSTGLLINELQFGDQQWSRVHLKSLKMSYGKTPFFAETMALIEPLFESPGESVAAFNMKVIRAIAAHLDIRCEFRVSSDLKPEGKADDRLVDLMRLVKGKTYVSGAGGQNYQEEGKFAAAGFDLDVRTYKPIPYDQGRPEFTPGLSILDAIFQLGRKAQDLLKYPEGT